MIIFENNETDENDLRKLILYIILLYYYIIFKIKN